MSLRQLLLAIDTSGKNGSITLARVAAGRPEVEIVETVPLAGGTFSAQLIPQISALLEKHRYNKKDLAAFAAVSGPGSFTGLRVGLAAIKALAEILHKPIAAVSLLDAVAQSGRSCGRVIAVLDAGRNEVYVGDYEISGEQGPPRIRRECLLSREEFIAEAKGNQVVTPDAALAEFLLSVGIQCEHVTHPGSAVVARLGWERILRGGTVRPEDLEANYIRRSDAEIFSQPKS